MKNHCKVNAQFYSLFCIFLSIFMLIQLLMILASLFIIDIYIIFVNNKYFLLILSIIFVNNKYNVVLCISRRKFLDNLKNCNKLN